MNEVRTIKSAETVFDILEHLRSENGARLTGVANELGMAKSTAHQYLATLELREFVVREGDEYHIGFRFLDYGEFARSRNPVFELAKDAVVELAELTEERAQFVIEEHGRGVYVYTATGERAVKTDSRIGKRVFLHATAAGKAILAHLPEERIDEIFERPGLEPVTDNTIVDPAALREEFEEIRDRGVAYNDQEDTLRLRAVGVPVKDAEGAVLGALSVSGPTHRFKGEVLEREIPDLLLGTANELELNIEYM
ncbi:IclR family transcriptional regulator [Halomarina halobia]|uniref:IclR family transcriptional regulator n=1 Tax=Halomarina halobia TaxID=3033386 RepID=A0ABD6AD47_9EURY|nr:IclR family transcriptional regulator [Halomarina sp. PSR21]